MTLLGPARQNTDPFWGVLTLSIQLQEVTPGSPPRNAPHRLPLPSESIGHGAERNGLIRAVILQPARGASTPVCNLLEQTRDDQGALENTAIQQQGIRYRDIDSFGHSLARSMTMFVQKTGEVAGNGRVGHIGQTKFHYTTALAVGSLGDGYLRKESIQHHRLYLIPPQFGSSGCANQSAATTQQGHVGGLGSIGGEEALLGDSALLDQLR